MWLIVDVSKCIVSRSTASRTSDLNVWKLGVFYTEGKNALRKGGRFVYKQKESWVILCDLRFYAPFVLIDYANGTSRSACALVRYKNNHCKSFCNRMTLFDIWGTDVNIVSINDTWSRLCRGASVRTSNVYWSVLLYTVILALCYLTTSRCTNVIDKITLPREKNEPADREWLLPAGKDWHRQLCDRVQGIQEGTCFAHLRFESGMAWYRAAGS